MKTSSAGNSWKGFSLLELLVVVFIFSLTLGIVLPRMRLSRIRMKTTTQSLISTFRHAREQAVVMELEREVNIDLDRQVFWLSSLPSEEDESGSEGPSQTADQGYPRSEIKLPDELRIRAVTIDSEENTSGLVTLTFYPDGTAMEGEIVLEDSRGRASCLRIDGATGKVETVEGEE